MIRNLSILLTVAAVALAGSVLFAQAHPEDGLRYDADGNGVVNSNDLGIVAAHFGDYRTPTPTATMTPLGSAPSNTPTPSPTGTAFASCAPGPPPTGAIAGQPGPIYACISGLAPSTFIDSPNGWADDFNQSEQNRGLGSYVHGDYGSVSRQLHWVHNAAPPAGPHWMVDVQPYDNACGLPRPGCAGDDYGQGGGFMRPPRTFRFVNERLVVEAEVAAGILAYSGDIWPELVVTTGPLPTEGRATSNGTYLYDFFPNHDTLGCRLGHAGVPTCALFDNTTRGPGQGGRVFELSHFQNGASPWGSGASSKCGGFPYGDGNAAACAPTQPHRFCEGQDPDTNCRDHFRWEIERDRFAIYVNGVLYMEHRGFPAAQQLPQRFLDADVYVFMGSALFRPDAQAVRFHWDSVSINP
jgi:hypothetical protein